MTSTLVLVHADPAAVAAAAAERLTTAVLQAQRERGVASLVLTGGGVGIATLRALAAGRGRTDINWRAVDLWWGDERFLPYGRRRAQRHPGPRRAAGPRRPRPARVHPMGAPDGPDGDDPEAAAARYAAELLGAALTATPRRSTC